MASTASFEASSGSSDVRPCRERRGLGLDVAALAVFWCTLGVTSTVASLFLAALWSDDLKRRLGVPTHYVELLNYTLDLANFFALPPGLVIGSLGPRMVLWSAPAMNGLGYLLLVLVVKDVLPAAFAFASMCLLGQAAIWTVMAVLALLGQMVTVEDKGKAIGLAMTWFSLAPVVVDTLVNLLLGSDKITPEFYAASGLLMSFAGLLGAGTLTLVPTAVGERRTGKSMGIPFAIAVTLIACLAVVAAGARPNAASVTVAAFLPVACGGSLILAVLARWRSRRQSNSACSVVADVELLRSVASDGTLTTSSSSAATTLPEAMGELRYWLVFLMFGILCGGGMEVSNHLEQLAHSVLWDKHQAVAFFALGNSLSRILVGVSSDMLVHRISRGSLLIIFSWVMCAALLLLSLLPASAAAVKVAVVLSGFAFGTPWLLVPAVEMEWYGDAHFGRIHGVMMYAAAAGVSLVRAVAAALPGRLCTLFCLLAVVLAAASATSAAAMRAGAFHSPASWRLRICSRGGA